MTESNVQLAGFSCVMSHFTATQFTRRHPKESAAPRKLHLPSSSHTRNHQRLSQPLVEREKNPERRRGWGAIRNLAHVFFFFFMPTQKILIDFPAGFDSDLRCSACDVLACISSVRHTSLSEEQFWRAVGMLAPVHARARAPARLWQPWSTGNRLGFSSLFLPARCVNFT